MPAFSGAGAEEPADGEGQLSFSSKTPRHKGKGRKGTRTSVLQASSAHGSWRAALQLAMVAVPTAAAALQLLRSYCLWFLLQRLILQHWRWRWLLLLPLLLRRWRRVRLLPPLFSLRRRRWHRPPTLLLRWRRRLPLSRWWWRWWLLQLLMLLGMDTPRRWWQRRNRSTRR